MKSTVESTSSLVVVTSFREAWLTNSHAITIVTIRSCSEWRGQFPHVHIGIHVQGCVHVYYVFLLLDFSGDHKVEGGGGEIGGERAEREKKRVPTTLRPNIV